MSTVSRAVVGLAGVFLVAGCHPEGTTPMHAAQVTVEPGSGWSCVDWRDAKSQEPEADCYRSQAACDTAATALAKETSAGVCARSPRAFCWMMGGVGPSGLHCKPTLEACTTEVQVYSGTPEMADQACREFD